jgi:hypothetical protein
MNPLFETYKLAIVNHTPGSNRAFSAAIDGASTPALDDRLKRVRELYRPLGKTKTGRIEPNVGVPDAG